MFCANIKHVIGLAAVHSLHADLCRSTPFKLIHIPSRIKQGLEIKSLCIEISIGNMVARITL